jgi:hypothetical protein
MIPEQTVGDQLNEHRSEVLTHSGENLLLEKNQ